MSRAFTREDDNEPTLDDIGERPVSTHRNLVTSDGLAAMDAELSALRERLALAEGEGDRRRIALVSRDLRYWNTRRETAELSISDPDDQVVRFGMTVTVADEDGETRQWRIVGEDEADVSQRKISHVSPMALALFGKREGDVVTVSGREWEIVSLGV